MSKLIDLTGQRFGRWTVIERAPAKVTGRQATTMWLCRCDCGNAKVVSGTNLKNGASKSCGCLSTELISKRSRIHAMSDTKIHYVWRGMKQRCTNPKHRGYPDYGGRGVTVCDEWLHNFQAFYNWAIVNGYKDGLSIDRIDNDKGYSPDNCRWVPRKVQNINKRTNRYIQIGTVKKSLSEWCEQYGMNYKTVCSRLRYGWTPEEALEIIPRKK